MKKVLLHICCGVCASSVVKKLREEDFNVVGFFYNPNIHPQEEYLKREAQAREVARIIKFDLITGNYDKDHWLAKTKELKDEPEGGKRCNLCFEIRLKQTSRKAKQLEFDYFTSTLSVSPHKKTAVINAIGRAIDQKGFIAFDFKKQDGFQLAIEFAKRYNLYRQNYCGCIYSRKKVASSE